MLYGSIGKLMNFDHLVWSNSKHVGAKEQPKPKVHDYTRHQCGVDYLIEAIAGTSHSYCITAQGRGIKLHHLISLQQNGLVEKYRVDAIDYYSSPSDMWAGTLTKIE